MEKLRKEIEKEGGEGEDIVRKEQRVRREGRD